MDEQYMKQRINNQLKQKKEIIEEYPISSFQAQRNLGKI